MVQTIACSAVSSRHESTTTTRCRAPVSVVEKLRRAQNNVARVICQQRRCIRARPLLKSFHWLLLQRRIHYKIAVIRHKGSVESTFVPQHIDELLQRQVTTRSLRSTNAPRPCVVVSWTLDTH